MLAGANNNNNNNRIMFMVLSSWQNYWYLMNVEQRQAAADPQTKPTDLGCESACRLLSCTSTSSLLLLIPKADTHFIIPRRIEGWVNLDTQDVRNLRKVFTQQRPGQESGVRCLRNARPTLYQLRHQTTHVTTPQVAYNTTAVRARTGSQRRLYAYWPFVFRRRV